MLASVGAQPKALYVLKPCVEGRRVSGRALSSYLAGQAPSHHRGRATVPIVNSKGGVGCCGEEKAQQQEERGGEGQHAGSCVTSEVGGGDWEGS